VRATRGSFCGVQSSDRAEGDWGGGKGRTTWGLHGVRSYDRCMMSCARKDVSGSGIDLKGRRGCRVGVLDEMGCGKKIFWKRSKQN